MTKENQNDQAERQQTFDVTVREVLSYLFVSEPFPFEVTVSSFSTLMKS